ncbi:MULTISPECIES: acyl-CoA carboxylase subunit epsilon [unclassified Amycolatopsis]|uniref:acyl-CoA carboxylase subunit epsilon n=1 Tax=unclassified Amycolatopsis TaxID=2618356 RepID=UPI001A903B4F|nr:MULTISPECIES: acyl-CoA carboxylase subunit epsilon [unclassified Amycolatopsis]HET6704351.1 acyl-CoA carboxylase subunit epsilon [Amycolatopsis sp.]
MSEESRPLLRVVRGNPSDAELAALTAVVAAASAAKAPEKPKPRTSWWGDHAVSLRRPLHPDEGAWRASALPQG